MARPKTIYIMILRADYVIPLKFPFTFGRFHGGKVSHTGPGIDITCLTFCVVGLIVVIVIQIHLTISC